MSREDRDISACHAMLQQAAVQLVSEGCSGYCSAKIDYNMLNMLRDL